MPDYFSVPIFFIVFRETVEAAIIVSVLLSFVEQLMSTSSVRKAEQGPPYNSISQDTSEQEETSPENGTADAVSRDEGRKKLVTRMRIQVWAGTISGFIVALAIGAAFIAVFYTKLTNLWADTEELWEGVFSLVAAIVIYVMGIAFLKMDRSRVKWRLKLSAAFDRSQPLSASQDKSGRSGKWALFLLPFITVLREGLEAVVFVGGVSLTATAVSIPIPVIVGIIAGAIVGYAIYKTGSSTTLHWFLVASTTLLFLIGAGLFSKSIGYFEYYTFAKGVGGDVAETGDGPGSFRVQGNVWHLTYGNPEPSSPSTNGGWQIFNSILGWNNNASIGTILAYIFYWLLIVGTLLYLKWSEGRMTLFGASSKAKERRERLAEEKSAPRSDSSGPSTSPEPSPPVEHEAQAKDLHWTGPADSPVSEKAAYKA